ncbi:MAG TPA: helix-turn-helix transcriptional regulator [Acetobacteraceae bacterium]|nr:helix-turn-helix transcriptional regulator [Acetobacteraceae bacterium]
MPVSRLTDPDRAPRPLVAKAEEYPSGSSIARHSHERAQLIFLSLGALRLQTDDGVWVTPPGRAAWIPGSTVHWANYTKRSSVSIAYVDTTAFDGLPRSCAVFALTGLLRELVMRAIDLGWHWPSDGRAERAMRVLVDEVTSLVPLGLFLPHGHDPRLRRVITALTAEPGDDRNLEDWTAVARTSPRTLARLFQTETGLSFGRWREQLRLICAIERLADGDSITRVAHDLGYSGAGAFTTMFTRAMGQPPRTYLASMSGNPSQGKILL